MRRSKLRDDYKDPVADVSPVTVTVLSSDSDTGEKIPTMGFDRYQLLRSRILANAYLIYPNKDTSPRYSIPETKSNETATDSRQLSQASWKSRINSAGTRVSNGSLPSSLVDVEVRRTHKRDLEVAICRYYETVTLSNPQDVFYAVVFDKNECSGYSSEEQHAQITKQRHKLRSHVLTTKPEEACGSEEEALLRLCERLEREASALVLGNGVVTRLDSEAPRSGIDAQILEKKSSLQDQLQENASTEHRDPGNSFGSSSESQAKTEEYSESQQQRLLAEVRNKSVETEGHSSPTLETTKAPRSESMDAAKPDERSSSAFETMDSYYTQPTQPVRTGDQGPYHRQLHLNR